MELSLELIRPKLSIGIKAISALTVVFWVPVILLVISLYFSFNKSLLMEGLDNVRTNLKGASVVYEERSKNLQSVLEQVTGNHDVRDMFLRRDSMKLQELLLTLGQKNTHAEILVAVNANQKVLSRRNGKTGDIIILGDALSRTLMTGVTVITTELVSKEFLALEEEGLANRIRDIGIAQFVISPVRYGDEITGAIVAGILLSGESWLGNTIHNRFGVEIALFAGETFESFYLHSTASLPRTTWIIGQSMPDGLKEEISLGKPYFGELGIEGINHITAFEPLRDSRNRVIGAIGVSRPAKNTTLIVAQTIGKSLLLVASGALVFAIIITVIISLDIKRPLNCLLRAMGNFEKGEMDSVIHLKTGDEFELLAQGFNDMAESVKRRENRLKKHYQVAKLLISTINLEELTDKILNVVIDVTESQFGILYLCRNEGQVLAPVVHYGCRADLPVLKKGEGFPGRALADRKCIIVHPREKEKGQMMEMGFIQFPLEEIAYIPLISKDSAIGTLVIGSTRRYSQDEQELFTYLGNQISIALDNTVMHRRIQELSIRDDLTGIYNRRFLFVRLEEEWSRCARHDEPLSVLLVDLDNFKEVNDTYGHTRGDEVLRSVGQTLLQLARKEDIVARYGGDEFVVVSTNMDSAEAAAKVNEIVAVMNNKKFPWSEKKITLSVGIATYPGIHVESAEELLHTADRAMYLAKAGGKNKVVASST